MTDRERKAWVLLGAAIYLIAVWMGARAIGFDPGGVWIDSPMVGVR